MLYTVAESCNVGEPAGSRVTPEQRARERIDAQLQAAGWLVQDRAQMDIFAGEGVAIREFSLLGGEAAGYPLYVDGQAIGVETQSAKYLEGLPPEVPTF
jgi:type I restriction enzyme R subunit